MPQECGSNFLEALNRVPLLRQMRDQEQIEQLTFLLQQILPPGCSISILTKQDYTYFSSQQPFSAIL